MKPRLLFTIAAVLALAYGVAFILFPAKLLSFYGVTLLAGGQWIGRFLGSAFLGLGVVDWLARNVERGEGLRAIMLGNFVFAATGAVVAILNIVYGPGNALFWFTFVCYLFLALAFAYYCFVSSGNREQ
jgi:hypothetical protein